MRVETLTITILHADEGKVLTNGYGYGYNVALSANDSQDNWQEIPEDEVEEGAEISQFATATEELNDTDALLSICGIDTLQKKVTRTDASRIHALLTNERPNIKPSDCGGVIRNFLPEYNWDGQTLIAYSTIFQYEGVAYQALNNTYDQPNFVPSEDTIGTLYQKVEFFDYKGKLIRQMPPVFIGTSNAFDLDELCYYNGQVWRCKQQTCVYTPTDAPTLWELVTEDDE